MNLRATLLRLACLASLLLTTQLAMAQQPAPTPPAAPDVLLLTTGQEVSGRVLTITPTELTYLPIAPTPPDTVRLPVSSVFLVRYANGTREVLTAPVPAQARDSVQSPLVGLTAEQRRQRGVQDARHYYHHSGPFWGAFASAVAISPLYGAIPAACIGFKHVAPHNLMAPQPQLLQDQAYASGYQRQANRQKTGRTWAGYGAGSAAYLALIAILLVGFTNGL